MTKRKIHISFGERRKTRQKRRIHCCCVCGKLAPWSKSWSWYGSYRDIDDGVPIMKFCSDKCKKHRLAVSEEMAAEAQDKEFRQCPS